LIPRVVLPASLRVFPLTGCILLPGNWLPLHIFEPRYRAMVRDALATDRLIGMIQPRVPAPDNVAPVGESPETPELHPVGCVGKIEHSLPEPDGRFHILLKGVSRFRLVEEMSEQAGYRWFHVSYEAFAHDFQEPRCHLDSSKILRAMEVLKQSHSLSIDPEDFRGLSGIAVLNGLSAALPFAPAEKQALLEAAGPKEREHLLLALMAMGFRQGTGTRCPPPSTIH
jgi:uncharacterized protein